MKSIAFLKPTWLGLYLGRDLCRDEGWLLDVGLIPRPDLRRRSEEGMMCLCAMRVEARFRTPRSRLGDWHQTRPHHWERAWGWRWPVQARVSSDAREIAERLAVLHEPTMDPFQLEWRHG